ncbi:hypothetical protein FVE85_8104 [Porphyridium purpureum]|uniref:Uncharacterized protein n=1 Tax=Porphyridium purpureum TaxID=35688 RepID=A0A5J4YQC9_PORPP|nr:hypothetical protein FVE85_8104 [Porphyridium purpureum]|eukprot:POR6029..scf295_9
MGESGKSARLPLEGQLYDRIDLGNFFDVGCMRPGLSISKTVRSDVLSSVSGCNLPVKVVLGYNFGSVWTNGWTPAMVAKLAGSIRLLNLSGPQRGSEGYLSVKWSKNTENFEAYGWEMDRKVVIVRKTRTALYGRVQHQTNSRMNGKWSLMSHFGIEQGFKLMGYSFAIRAGLTPERAFKFDFKM